MKGFIKRGAAIVVAGMLLTGCGEELKTLTESEEVLIVNYSVGIVGKFNRYQEDGITAVVPPEEVDAEDTEDTSGEDTDKDTEKTPEGKTNKDKGKTPEEDEKEVKEAMNLTEAVAIPGIEVTYEGYDMSKSYQEGDSFLLDAPEGKTYFIMKAKITNTGNEEIECNILNKMPTFTLSLNGTAPVKNELTMLPNDLSIYEETIAPGTSADTVLIFKVSEKEANNITSGEVNVQINGNSGKVTI